MVIVVVWVTRQSVEVWVVGGVVWCGVVWCRVCDVATVTGTGPGAGVV